MARTEKKMRLAAALKKAILYAYQPEAVILFGSLARGDADEFSDVDLLVVMETDRDVKDLSKEMTEYLSPITKDKHIIVRTPKVFCRQRDIPGTIVFSAAREGQILFEKTGRPTRNPSANSYRARKKEVIRQEYWESARGFLVQAESFLQEGRVFRCRDFARFAAARAIKGLFVKHDIHPPRETDLEGLLNKATELEPDLVRHRVFVRELNRYCPAKADFPETRKIRGLLEKASRFVREMIALGRTDRKGKRAGSGRLVRREPGVPNNGTRP